MQFEQFANTVGVRQVRFGATVTQGDKEQPVRFCEKARRKATDPVSAIITSCRFRFQAERHSGLTRITSGFLGLKA